MTRATRWAALGLLIAAGCGDDVSDSDAGSGGSGGASTGTGANGPSTGSGDPGCPTALPAQGAPCFPNGQSCNYGQCCPTFANCVDGTWQIAATGCAEQTCPSAPPMEGDSCECFTTPTCVYNSCGSRDTGIGAVVEATCGSSGWHVQQTPCADIPCGDAGLVCMPDELCVESQQGDGNYYSCENNPCNDGPTSCDCALGLCNGLTCIAATPTSLTCSCQGCP